MNDLHLTNPLNFGQVWKKFACFLLAASILGCSGNRKDVQGAEKRVEEIPISGSFSNAELIRNPVSLRENGMKEIAAAISFADTLFDFGQVEEGQQITHTFSFTNTGKGPLLISRAYSTCGCTVPEWPSAPVPPGGTGEISVRFDTQGRVGKQLKPVTITANTSPSATKVYLAGEVAPAAGTSLDQAASSGTNY